MHPAFQAQVDAALRAVQTEEADAQKMPDDQGTKIDFGRGQTTAKITGDAIVSTEIAVQAPSGPSLKPAEAPTPTGPTASPRYSGKAGR